MNAALRRVPPLAGLISVMVGTIVFAGWALNVAALQTVLPGLPSMKANTSLCFILTGLALFLMRDGAHRLAGAARVLAVAALTIAGLTLTQSLTGVHLGLDELFFRDPMTTPPRVPGRMSPITAISFVLLACAMLTRRRWVVASQLMGLSTLLICGIVLADYLYHAEIIIIYTSVAVHTAVVFWLLSLGVLCCDADRGILAVFTSAGSGGIMARRFLPAAIFVPLLFGWLNLLGQGAGWYDAEIGIVLQTVALGTVFSVLIWFSGRTLSQTDSKMAAARFALQAAHDEMEARVAERTAELATTNAALQVENAERRQAEGALHRSETKFRTLYDSSSDAVMLLDQKGFFDCNPATLAVFGCAMREEFCSKHPADLSPPVQPDGADSVTLASQRIATAMQKGSNHFEWMHKRADTGETFPADVLLTAMALDDKPVLQAVVRDITERKRNEAELQRIHAELEQRIADATTANDSLHRQSEELRRVNEERAALRNMIELLTACANPEEAYEIFRRAAAGLFPSLNGALHIFAASRDHLTPAATWGEWPDAATPVSPEDCWGLRSGKSYVGNGITTAPCGHAGPAREVATLCVPLVAYGEVLGVLHLRSVDASTVQSTVRLANLASDGFALALANLRLRESLKAQSIRDPLTDLFNRRYLTETLEREFARAQRSGSPVAVIMLDVDHFKRFNDSFGHDAGDAVLRELGTFLRRSVRAEDIACRYGGEEFCLVLPQMDHEGARQRAEAIRAGAARLEVKSNGRALGPVTLSLGVALFPADAMTITSVLAAADASLYQAKREGRNRVVMSRAAGDPGVTAAADVSPA